MLVVVAYKGCPSCHGDIVTDNYDSEKDIYCMACSRNCNALFPEVRPNLKPLRKIRQENSQLK